MITNTREARIEIFKAMLAEKHTILWQTWCVDSDKGRQKAAEWAVDLFEEMFQRFIDQREDAPATSDKELVFGPSGAAEFRRDREPCPIGISGHVWSLSIEEGKVALDCNCDTCNEDVLAPAGVEIMGMDEITGRLEFGHEHAGQPHRGPGPCDCNFWWMFVPGIAA